MKMILLLFGLMASNAYADIPRAYRLIANQYGIPVEIFYAVALQESGKSGRNKFLPWPWTLNIDKKGYYFDTREDAEIALLEAMDEAKQKGRVGRVAVGLAQIYMPSHVKNFESPIQALDPARNLNYAAKLLVEHYANTIEEGCPDWWVAVGRYHSPGNKRFANDYRQLVFKKCLKISARCHTYGATSMPTMTRLASVN